MTIDCLGEKRILREAERSEATRRTFFRCAQGDGECGWVFCQAALRV